MKGMNNEYSYTFHNSYISFRKVFPKQGLSVLQNNTRKHPYILDWVLLTKGILD